MGSTDANAGMTSTQLCVSIEQNDHHNSGNSSCVLATASRWTLMPIVGVRVTGDIVSKRCFAFLDAVASQSFCSRDLLNKLGIYNRTSDYNLTTLTSIFYITI